MNSHFQNKNTCCNVFSNYSKRLWMVSSNCEQNIGTIQKSLFNKMVRYIHLWQNSACANMNANRVSIYRNSCKKSQKFFCFCYLSVGCLPTRSVHTWFWPLHASFPISTTTNKLLHIMWWLTNSMVLKEASAKYSSGSNQTINIVLQNHMAETF